MGASGQQVKCDLATALRGGAIAKAIAKLIIPCSEMLKAPNSSQAKGQGEL